MIIPSIFAIFCFFIGILFLFYGVRNGFMKKDIQTSHFGSRAEGKQAVIMGVIYIFGGVALLWGSYFIVTTLYLQPAIF